jgi:hypothetical protein
MRPDVHVRVRRTSGYVRRLHRRPPWWPSAAATGGRRGPTALRLPEEVAVLQGHPTEADGYPVRWRPSAIAVRLRRPSGAVRLHRSLSMTPISPFYTMCLLL